jgi:hypothetical protein
LLTLAALASMLSLLDARLLDDFHEVLSSILSALGGLAGCLTGDSTLSLCCSWKVCDSVRVKGSKLVLLGSRAESMEEWRRSAR